ncbi:MAG TPA: PIN domain-containing protein [Rhizomicrobium sp.]|nr:PIN domain-containing protein [Rhizomicrobium sp.]
MKIALDTNLLVYAEGVDDPQRQAAAEALLGRLPREDLVISVQVLGEMYNVLGRRGMPRAQARAAVQTWQTSIPAMMTTSDTMNAALDLAERHRLKVWDAVILAAAAEAGCVLLISEDFQDGFVWNGVTVANPFRSPLHPLLASALRR